MLFCSIDLPQGEHLSILFWEEIIPAKESLVAIPMVLGAGEVRTAQESVGRKHHLPTATEMGEEKLAGSIHQY